MENVLTDQIFYFFENIFSKYQTGFRKVLNPQSCLVAMIEKFKKSLDQGVEYAELLMDLPKAFDCLPHNLIIAKFHAYEFDKASLRLTHSHLTGRYQKVKINNSYSLWVPQGSILDPILFNIFLCDMFFMIDTIDIASYTTQKMTFSITDFFSKCNQILRKLRIWSHLLKKPLMKNLIFSTVLC